jgi:TolB-like protein
MKNLSISALLILILAGCSIQPETISPNHNTVKNNQFQTISSNALGYNQQSDKRLVKNINHYVRGIMHGLVDNLQYVTNKTPIGVASFVFVDSKLDKTSILGQQISESFMHEIHQFGIPVVDYKVTDYVRVTNEGDFVFSRDVNELAEKIAIDYILSGTIVKHQGGYLINARIIGLQSKAIVASAQGFIPNDVAEALTYFQQNSGVLLIQG